MKKVTSVFFIFLILATLLTLPGYASTVSVTTTTTVFENGSYLVTTVSEQTLNRSARSTTYTKIENTRFDYYNKDNEKLLDFTLTSTFEVMEGVSATCTDATYSYSIYDSSWKLDSASAWKEANIGYGTATFKEKVLFITVNTVNMDAKVICDIYGNISY